MSTKQRTEEFAEKLDQGMPDGFGADFDPLPEAESYYPTRFEYFAGKIITGLCTGRAEKDLKTVVFKTLKLARELEDNVDSAQS